LLSGIRIERSDERSVVRRVELAAHSYKAGRDAELSTVPTSTCLRKNGDELTIARKKIVLVNDVIPSVLDVYSV